MPDDVMRQAVIDGLRGWCGSAPDFSMSSKMLADAADFVMAQPGMFSTAQDLRPEIAREVEYEVMQANAFGDGDGMVAGSTSLAEAQHYAAVYAQDKPTWIVEVTRRRLTA